ncbi:hypothetical protein [Methylobacterium soli]|uniref:Uncharacterized protein n=1 Tax=Methylobacterium soli TaxID=553447 RepID=A0A6L3SUX7_9HYPH|nr:hypothetical protein [Methylobacterium soli]KAB1077291.1 hypothetical protein F6X53_19590 [Methylobacterium soli]GJE46559.1 hypothetical protein AEGHOMDF_5765 [Methylobacterium soli]
MSRTIWWACLAIPLAASPPAARAAEGTIAVAQGSARNVVSVIQARNPFLTRSSSRTVRTGHTTVTEIVAIGPDPLPLTIRQSGLINRIRTYQRGTAPSLDARQDGLVNLQRGQQQSIP